jgi:flagellar FliJ protein
MPARSLSTLVTLLDHAQAERDRALSAARQADDVVLRAQAQADQLAQYRAEYLARWATQFARSGTPELLQCYHSFMQRLDQALEQQSAQVANVNARAAAARALLQDKEMRVASVRKLIERRQQAQQAQESRMAQKQTDEAAQRAGWEARSVFDLH